MDEDAQNKAYIQKIHPLFEKLVIDLLINKPIDFVQYMKYWLDEKGEEMKTQIQPSSKGFMLSKLKTTQMRDDIPESDEDDEDDEIDELPQPKPQSHLKQRSSVSAEVYGMFNKKGEFKAKIIQKTEEQKQKILARIKQAFMFSALDEKETNIVIDAMAEKKFSSGQYVITQGEEGDSLYVVDSGQLECTKRFGQNTEPTYLKTYQPGESFGELALLYNAPRAANIIAKNDCILYELDRETFNHIVKDAAAKKRQKYENFLSGVDLLKSIDPYERQQIADALQRENFKKGEYVVQQGEEGDKFYMIEEGQLCATKQMNQGESAQEVYNYKSGDYFGELALIKDLPRQASILCKTDCILVTLNRQSFKRMLGPIEDILKRNEDRYSKYM